MACERALVCLLLLTMAVVDGVKVEKVMGRQHPDAHLDGFVLKSVFLHDSKSDTVVRRMLRFDDNPHLRNVAVHAAKRGLKQTPWPEFSATENSKDRVIALAKLNLLAYDGQLSLDTFYSEKVMSEIYTEGESIFDVTSREEEKTAIAALRQLILDELAATTEAAHQADYTPESTQLDGTTVLSSGIGVAAYEFERGNVTVLTYRGTATDGDYKNIYNWLHDWVLEKMTDRMETIWKDEAGLEWTDELESRSNEGTKTSTGLICGFNSQSAGLGSTLSDASDVTTQQQAKDTGYWQITKAITDEAYEASEAAGTGLIISGHSQGGTRAALASMYLRKQDKRQSGDWVPAVTFAATGPQCVARLMFSDADLTSNVDPYIEHSQVTEYVHVLDPWGQALGEENGNVCLYGVANIEETSAYKYCSQAWGHPGPNLWFNEGADAVSFLGWTLQVAPVVTERGRAQDEDLLMSMKRCRYFTHYIEAMVLELQKDGVLNDDGTTAAAHGGCKQASVASLNDATGICPDPGHSSCEDVFALWIIALIVVLGVLCCCGAGMVWFCCCRKKPPPVRESAAGEQPAQIPQDNVPMAYNAEAPAYGGPPQAVPVDGYEPQQGLYPKLS